MKREAPVVLFNTLTSPDCSPTAIWLPLGEYDKQVTTDSNGNKGEEIR